MQKIKVLIVDDSALVRQVLSRGLQQDPMIQVVGAAANGLQARRFLQQLKPHVLTLDVEMPGMNGITFLKQLMRQNPLPVIMVSSLTEKNSRTTLEALYAGAIDIVLKPSQNIRNGLNKLLSELRHKIKSAARANVGPLVKNRFQPTTHTLKLDCSLKTERTVIAVGASTGGTEALGTLVSALPEETPGMVVVQHMPAGFTRLFAQRLNEQTRMSVKEAQSGDLIKNGQVLIAPGDYHVQVVRYQGAYRVICRRGERVNGHRPSVEVLFRSMARHVGSNAIGVMLTGMGHDGAEAMALMRQAGARTVAQDEATSVVFGMPKEAYLRGGAERLAAIERIPEIIKAYLDGTL